MNVSLKKEYRGYEIVFNENNDEWYCHDLGKNYSSEKMSTIKARIDRLIAAQKKKTSFDVLKLSGAYTNFDVTPAKVTAYEGPKFDKSYSTGYAKKFSHHNVQVSSVRLGSSRASSSIQSLDTLALITPENNSLIKEAFMAKRTYLAAGEALSEAIKKIQRMKVSDIPDLVKISGIAPSETVD